MSGRRQFDMVNERVGLGTSKLLKCLKKCRSCTILMHWPIKFEDKMTRDPPDSGKRHLAVITL